MNRPNQNNELDEISNINGNISGLRTEDNLNFISPYISSSESNTFHLESNNDSFYLNLHIFEIQEQEKKIIQKKTKKVRQKKENYI